MAWFANLDWLDRVRGQNPHDGALDKWLATEYAAERTDQGMYCTVLPGK
jgi:hypothetical protein